MRNGWLSIEREKEKKRTLGKFSKRRKARSRRFAAALSIVNYNCLLEQHLASPTLRYLPMLLLDVPSHR